MTQIEKLDAIAKYTGAKITTLDGMVDTLRSILKSMPEQEAQDFMIDTFMMLSDEIDNMYEEIA
jgi:methyl coenzyme M reductase subunit C-like uncharacterized protein (methanogenesis marker protein 7)